MALPSTGEVFEGKIGTKSPEFSKEFEQLMKWADERARLHVHANADAPKDSCIARNFGAVGIGLCRTEHMFFGDDRIDYVRGMILADSPEERKYPLEELKKNQIEDFNGILEVMQGFPVTIRLLDPPLHEFLPELQDEEEIQKLSKKFKKSAQDIKAKISQLKEFNPMLGHRGCRLGITFPDIYKMQTEAIIESACRLKEKGIDARPEIMIPLVSDVNEYTFIEKQAREIASNIIGKCGVKLNYKVGTMIEIPRACLVADEIAEHAEFFSFGTNDLTQMGFGFSRDDSAKFLKQYKEIGIIDRDPFQSLDQKGIGELIKIAIKKGRKANPKLIIGICGEHGGDPSSVEFCHKAGLNYVSCSPFRVPIARIAAAQAAIKNPE
jgi:pyruvate,orthophosphate dikinase